MGVGSLVEEALADGGAEVRGVEVGGAEVGGGDGMVEAEAAVVGAAVEVADGRVGAEGAKAGAEAGSDASAVRLGDPGERRLLEDHDQGRPHHDQGGSHPDQGGSHPDGSLPAGPNQERGDSEEEEEEEEGLRDTEEGDPISGGGVSPPLDVLPPALVPHAQNVNVTRIASFRQVVSATICASQVVGGSESAVRGRC